ncbi:MAG: DUF4286 family protein [Bacteroidota bacterium]
MIIYSVTVSVEDVILTDWLDWMRNVHIPDVMKTGHFAGWQMRELIDPPPQDRTKTYNIQYEMPDMDAYLTYQRHHAKALQADHKKRYGERAVAFRSLLKDV